MNAENIERIAYRFTEQEIAALLKLMNAAALPGTGVTAAEPSEATVSSLVESGIVLPCGERTFVDRTISLVLMNAARNARFLRAEAGEKRVVLYVGTEMCVLLEENGQGILTIEPLQNFRAAREPFMTAVGDMGGSPVLTLTEAESGAGETGGTADIQALFERLEKGEV